MDLIKEFPKGIIKWYKFHKSSNVLYVSAGLETDESIVEALKESGMSVNCVKVNDAEAPIQADQFYDYIVVAGALERSKNVSGMMKQIRSILKEDGTLLLVADNRLGIRYFCGDRDPFTDRNFDGIENYTRIDMANQTQLDGRLYAKSEIENILECAGFMKYRFYSVFPEIKRAQILIAEDYIPQEELDIRIFPQYYYPNTVFLEEEKLYTTLMRNNMFHVMANGFFVECSLTNSFSDVNQITVSIDRGKKNAMYTIIRRDKKVEKRPIYQEGYDKNYKLISNNEYLKAHGVKMIEAVLENEVLVMPYVYGIPATNYFRNQIKENPEKFLKQLDIYWNMILNSSERVPYEEVNWEEFEPGWEKRKSDDPNKHKWRKVAFGSEKEQENLGVILRRGYMDLVSLNSFFVNGEFVFYDQEMYIENVPAYAILLRTIDFIYEYNEKLELIVSKKKLLEKYHLIEYQTLFYSFISYFLEKLRNDERLLVYNNSVRRDAGIINSNRQRMNYSAEEYERFFRDIFKGTEGRELYLFGSGNFAKKFLSQFGAYYPVKGIIDNKQEKWGTDLQGIPIYSPEYLKTLLIGSYKIIICIKNYVPVMKQLKKLGIEAFSIFDSNMKYPRKQSMISPIQKEESRQPKKYHIGYIAGVFDLFHIGHLNMFKRAKEQCDYLIVGVVNDASVMMNKKTTPIIPFEERIEIVRSCRYVDEVVEIPTEYCDTDEAYRRYQFDVQFSGSDYEYDPVWLAKKAFLQKQGSDMVFFPYTQSTSSTKLKEVIKKKLD